MIVPSFFVPLLGFGNIKEEHKVKILKNSVNKNKLGISINLMNIKQPKKDRHIAIH